MSAAYCIAAEITTLGINPDALVDVEPTQKAAAIAAASDKMDGYLSSQFKLPLLTFGQDVRTCCAVLSGAHLLRVRGYNPEADPSVKETFDAQMQWLRDVARGIVRPQVVDSSPAAKLGVPSSQPRITSAASRGFSRMPPGSTFGDCGGGGSFGS